MSGTARWTTNEMMQKFPFELPLWGVCSGGEVTMCMSVHGGLEAWQAGEITAARALALTGAEGLLDLYALAAECGVEIRTEPTPGERAAAAAVVAALQRLMPPVEDTDHPHAA